MEFTEHENYFLGIYDSELVGRAFSFWQFSNAERIERSAGLSDEFELKTNVASIAFKTRSIAALVLFVSIAYLMIYTVFVYPISIGSDQFTSEIGSTVGDRNNNTLRDNKWNPNAKEE